MWLFINIRDCSAWINKITGSATNVLKLKCVVLWDALDSILQTLTKLYRLSPKARAFVNNSEESTIIKSTALDWKRLVGSSKGELASTSTSRGHSVVGNIYRTLSLRKLQVLLTPLPLCVSSLYFVLLCSNLILFNKKFL